MDLKIDYPTVGVGGDSKVSICCSTDALDIVRNGGVGAERPRVHTCATSLGLSRGRQKLEWAVCPV